VGGVLGLVALMGIAFLGMSASTPGDSSLQTERNILAERVKTLEEELRQKELASTVDAKRMEEAQAQASAPETPSSPGEEQASVERPVPDEGPLTSLPEPRRGPSRASPPDYAAEQSEAPPQTAPPVAAVPEQTRPPDAGPAAVNFNAQNVTAVSESPNRGMLSFSLVKDQPDMRFSGYLFVFVEMVDKRGENKIYAYPKRTRLGEGDLPVDYRAGESLTFKYNSRVELPYQDIRMGANLTGVSILLYGEDGDIVFQRGFDRSELKLVGTKATKVNGVVPKASKKRRAL